MADKLKKMACQALERAENLKKILSPVSVSYQNVTAAPRSTYVHFISVLEMLFHLFKLDFL